ncbi:MAG: hypothetical protein H0W64_10720 [Gammaproteobacteria bacterium]|nr:hypothetical protein [Gammaproteobacteria bacterium]
MSIFSTAIPSPQMGKVNQFIKLLTQVEFDLKNYLAGLERNIYTKEEADADPDFSKADEAFNQLSMFYQSLLEILSVKVISADHLQRISSFANLLLTNRFVESQPFFIKTLLDIRSYSNENFSVNVLPSYPSYQQKKINGQGFFPQNAQEDEQIDLDLQQALQNSFYLR